MTLAPIVVRLVVLLAGVALFVAPGSAAALPAVVTAVGTLLAVVAPRLVGSSIASAGFVLAWLSATGWHETPSLGRTIGAAAALYVLHVSAALAACVPMGTRVAPWRRRALGGTLHRPGRGRRGVDRAGRGPAAPARHAAGRTRRPARRPLPDRGGGLRAASA